MTATGPIESAKSLIGRRPAETATAIAGAIGLLLSSLVDDGNEDVRIGLVILLSALPAITTYIHDLGQSKRLPHDLGREIEELSLRAIRRARLGHEEWARDVEAAEKLAALRKALAPANPPAKSPDTPAKPETKQ